MNLEWKVFVENINTRKIETFNIFDHPSFKRECESAYKKHKDNLEEFEDEVRANLLYYFWSKCEWEIEISSLFKGENDLPRKVDVYEQVVLNWEAFVIYLATKYAFL